MKLLYTISLALTLCVFTTNAQHDCMHHHREAVMRSQTLLSQRESFVTPAMQLYDVTYYRLDVNFPGDELLRFGGNVVMELTSLSDALSEIELHLGTNARLDSVLARGLRIPDGSVTRDNDVIRISLPYNLARDESLALRLYYSSLYSGSAIMFRRVRNVVLDEQIVSIASQAEPYDARRWWPCKDDPADKADSVDIILTVPEDLYPVSNGLVQSDINNGDGTRTVHWKSRYPIVTYLVSIAAAKYNYREFDFSYDGRSMPVGSWWYGMSGNAMASYEQDMLEGLQLYSDLFDVYPFIDEKYGMAEYEWGGAMEHQTVSSMGFYSTGVVAHELMHQWFGNKVTCASFHHIWLNEGWATYGESLFFESRGGLPALKANMAAKAYYGPGTIYVHDPTDFARIFSGSLSYNKASWVVHMLRGILGDEVFFAAARKYLGGESHEYYRSVTTEEFRQIVEAESGLDLEDFFQNWIYGEYFPTYQFEWDRTSTDDGYDATVIIEQLYVPTRQLFIMPIEIYIRFADGSDSSIVVQNNMQLQSWTFSFTQEPTSIQLDPDNWILKRVIEKINNPSFAKGILLVNGVDWSVDAYRPAMDIALADSVFTGKLPYTYWDLFAPPAGGYPDGVPQPIGSGAIPGNVLGEYCTVVWLGNAYNGDDAFWANTSMMEYLRAGGNIVLLSRMGSNFITEDFRQFLGITWIPGYSTLNDCKSTYPGLVDMEFTGDQNLVNAFRTQLLRPENIILFTNSRTSGDDAGVGVWAKPVTTGEMNTGHMMFLAMRPYRLEPEQLSHNMAMLLDLLPCEPVLSVERPSSLPSSVVLHANYPNPFRSETTLRFSLDGNEAGHVSLRLFDILGRPVRDVFSAHLRPGEYSMTLDARDLSSGVYLLHLHHGTSSAVRRVVVME